MIRTKTVLLLAVLAILPPFAAGAQEAGQQGAAQAPIEDDPDLDFNASQPDFSIVTLPTTLRVPHMKSAFRVTHRFARPLGAGDVGDLAEDLFGLDSGGQIGLEYRFGLLPGVQAGVHRTSERTIQLFGLYNVVREGDGTPLGLTVLASVDGTDNFRDRYSPAVGVVISRELGQRGAFYLQPVWVGNSNPAPDALAEDDDTFLLGIGLRVRIRPTVYLVGEFAPRAGYAPDSNHGTFGIEKRAGGHTFQVNFSNGFGTTMGQIAQGGTGSEDWYLGFNISRKFF